MEGEEEETDEALGSWAGKRQSVRGEVPAHRQPLVPR